MGGGYFMSCGCCIWNCFFFKHFFKCCFFKSKTLQYCDRCCIFLVNSRIITTEEDLYLHITWPGVFIFRCVLQCVPVVHPEDLAATMPCSWAEWRRWIRPLVLVLYCLLLVAVLPLCIWELQKDKVGVSPVPARYRGRYGRAAKGFFLGLFSSGRDSQ